MAQLGTYNIPKEFQDEDKWFRFFTKTQLVYIAIAGVLSFGLIWLFAHLHLVYIGIFLSVFIFLCAILMAFVTIPTSRYMIGGGYRISHIVGRLIMKHVMGRGKTLYIKNYDSEKEDI